MKDPDKPKTDSESLDFFEKKKRDYDQKERAKQALIDAIAGPLMRLLSADDGGAQ